MLLYKSGINSGVLCAEMAGVSAFTFSKFTTYGLGGGAREAFFPKTVREAKNVYRILSEQGKSIEIIGNGSNILASDKGFDGAVISTRNMCGIVRLSDNRLLCLAGTKISCLLKYCKDRGLGGLEYLYGIPATVGGAAFMNAGVSGKTISDNIVNVHIYDGHSTVLDNKSCNFGYRRSTMRDIKALILSIILKTYPCNVKDINEKLSYYKNRRCGLPKGKSCGCVFKNPSNDSAGRLIEAAGLKGMSLGGAYVSCEHANFIINGGSSAQDVKDLIAYVKARVMEKFGVLLEEEVVYIGDFNDFNG